MKKKELDMKNEKFSEKYEIAYESYAHVRRKEALDTVLFWSVCLCVTENAIGPGTA